MCTMTPRLMLALTYVLVLGSYGDCNRSKQCGDVVCDHYILWIEDTRQQLLHNMYIACTN